MKNSASLNFYTKMARKPLTQQSVKILNTNDHSHLDIEFIKKLADSNKTLIDLGAGTGLIANFITKEFKHITAVEYFEEFSKFIINDSKLSLIHANLLEFEPTEKFDIAIMFGVAHYFNETESFLLYKKVYELLETKGIFILKQQFGVEKTKTVTYSEELQSDYFAQYRELHSEIARLEEIGFTDIEYTDIYPKEANRFDDTHFYALVAHKK